MAASVMGHSGLCFGRRIETTTRSCSSSCNVRRVRSLMTSSSSLSWSVKIGIGDGLGFGWSEELGGMKMSRIISQPTTPQLHPLPIVNPIVARRICPFTGKKANRANIVSHSNHKTKKLQFVNLQYKRVWWEGGKRFLKLRLSTKALKTIEKNGLDAVAKKAGIDLTKK